MQLCSHHLLWWALNQSEHLKPIHSGFIAPCFHGVDEEESAVNAKTTPL
jgi:hypothetical protein